MIYWFTGQPSHGKTTFAKMLKKELEIYNKMPIFHIDGDNLREITFNKDYSEKGRIDNVKNAQIISNFLHKNNQIVIVSLVSPYRWQREEFKNNLLNNIIEFYIYSNKTRERDHYRVENYEKPLENFVEIDTTFDSPEESLKKIIDQINQHEKLHS